MAQRTEIRFIDDLDGSQASETVQFGIDNIAYEIDLSTTHATELRQALQPYLAAAREAGSITRRAAQGSRSTGPNPSEVRAWAKAEGLQVSDRGRVPDELVVKFRAADQEFAPRQASLAGARR